MEELEARIFAAERRLRRLQTNPAPTVPNYGLGAFTPPPPPTPVPIALIAGSSDVGGSPILVIYDDFTFGLAATSLGGNVGFCIATNGSYFLYGGQYNIAFSSGGTSWGTIYHDTSGEQQFTDLEWCGSLNLWSIVNSPLATPRPIIYSSPDGSSLTSHSTPWDADGGYINGLGWSSTLNKLLVCGSSEAGSGIFYTLMQSVDATSFSSVDTSPAVGNQFYDAAWSPALGIWALVGPAGDGNGIYSSPDGVTVTPRRSGGIWTNVVWSPDVGRFVAVGTSTSLSWVWSDDGITWHNPSSGANTGGVMCGVGWSQQAHLFLSAIHGSVWTSPDGDVWSHTISGTQFTPSGMNGVLGI